jgi:hypothetical protein
LISLIVIASVLIGAWQLVLLVGQPDRLRLVQPGVVILWWVVTAAGMAAALWIPSGAVTPFDSLWGAMPYARVGALALTPLLTILTSVFWLIRRSRPPSVRADADRGGLASSVARAALRGAAIGTLLAIILAIWYPFAGDEGQEGLMILWGILGLPCSQLLLLAGLALNGIEPVSRLLFLELPANYGLIGAAIGLVLGLRRRGHP